MIRARWVWADKGEAICELTFGLQILKFLSSSDSRPPSSPAYLARVVSFADTTNQPTKKPTTTSVLKMRAKSFLCPHSRTKNMLTSDRQPWGLPLPSLIWEMIQIWTRCMSIVRRYHSGKSKLLVKRSLPWIRILGPPWNSVYCTLT